MKSACTLCKKPNSKTPEIGEKFEFTTKLQSFSLIFPHTYKTLPSRDSTELLHPVCSAHLFAPLIPDPLLLLFGVRQQACLQSLGLYHFPHPLGLGVSGVGFQGHLRIGQAGDGVAQSVSDGDLKLGIFLL